MGMKHVTTTRVHCRVTTVQVQDKQLLIKNKMGVSFAKQRYSGLVKQSWDGDVIGVMVLMSHYARSVSFQCRTYLCQ